MIPKFVNIGAEEKGDMAKAQNSFLVLGELFVVAGRAQCYTGIRSRANVLVPSVCFPQFSEAVCRSGLELGWQVLPN